MSYYQQSIQTATNCTSSDTNEIEEFMRDERPTLDSLSSAQFNKLARSAWQTVQYLRTPEGKAAWDAAVAKCLGH